MGTFNTDGIAAEIEKFEGLAKASDEVCEKAVKAGGKVLAKRLAEAAPVNAGNRRDIKPGALKKSVRAGKVKYNAADGFHCDVGPVGKDARGEPFAKIGNILEYGRSDMEPQPWFNTTVNRATEEVTQAMEKVFREAQGDG